MHPEQAHKVDLDHVGLIIACRTASESGEGEAPRRSSSGCAADVSHAIHIWNMFCFLGKTYTAKSIHNVDWNILVCVRPIGAVDDLKSKYMLL